MMLPECYKSFGLQGSANPLDFLIAADLADDKNSVTLARQLRAMADWLAGDLEMTDAGENAGLAGGYGEWNTTAWDGKSADCWHQPPTANNTGPTSPVGPVRVLEFSPSMGYGGPCDERGLLILHQTTPGYGHHLGQHTTACIDYGMGYSDGRGWTGHDYEPAWWLEEDSKRPGQPKRKLMV